MSLRAWQKLAGKVFFRPIPAGEIGAGQKNGTRPFYTPWWWWFFCLCCLQYRESHRLFRSGVGAELLLEEADESNVINLYWEKFFSYQGKKKLFFAAAVLMMEQTQNLAKLLLICLASGEPKLHVLIFDTCISVRLDLFCFNMAFMWEYLNL